MIELKLMILLYLTQISYAVNIREKMFRALSENILYNNDVLGNMNNVTTMLACGTSCLVNSGCVSFLYHKDGQFCRMYVSKSPGIAESTSYPGAMFYQTLPIYGWYIHLLLFVPLITWLLREVGRVGIPTVG